MSPFKNSETYGGIDRRASIERRNHADRRNLVRYESVGCNRRGQSYRRKEDEFWLGQSL